MAELVDALMLIDIRFGSREGRFLKSIERSVTRMSVRIRLHLRQLASKYLVVLVHSTIREVV